MPKVQQDQIEEALLSTYVKWDLYANTNQPYQRTQGDDTPQFVHGFIKDGKGHSQFTKIPTDIMGALGVPPNKILRAKANLLMWERAPKAHPKHIDDESPHLVFIYYVNDSDGDTHVYDGDRLVERVSPRKGRGLLFDGGLFHSSSSPVENRFRLVVNFNILPGDDFA